MDDSGRVDLFCAHLGITVARMSISYAQAVSQQVRERMREQSVSVVALAETTGIPRVTLTRRLSGSSAFSVAELAAVSDALGVLPSYWMHAAEAAS